MRGLIGALFAALERVGGSLGVAPLLDFLSAPVPLPSSAGIELVSQDRMAEALNSAKAVLSLSLPGPTPLATPQLRSRSSASHVLE